MQNRFTDWLRSALAELCFIACFFAAISVFAADRPNILFILSDDQGYGDLGAHGNPVLRTPNLDRLRSESVRFTDFQVSPTCSPTSPSASHPTSRPKSANTTASAPSAPTPMSAR